MEGEFKNSRILSGLRSAGSLWVDKIDLKQKTNSLKYLDITLTWDLINEDFLTGLLILHIFLQILLTLHSVQYHTGDDKSLWNIICKSEYRRCAVIECYEGIKNVIFRILKEGSLEYNIFKEYIFGEIDASWLQGRFTTTFKLNELVNIHNRVLHLIDVLLTKPSQKHVQKVRGLDLILRLKFMPAKKPYFFQRNRWISFLKRRPVLCLLWLKNVTKLALCELSRLSGRLIGQKTTNCL